MTSYDPTADPEMRAMLAKAKRDGLWFHTSYQDIWLSPAEIEAAWRDGRFRWGPPNWHLRDPREYLDRTERKIVAAFAERDRIARAKEQPR